jgi:CO dehydrogenase maturation factor
VEGVKGLGSTRFCATENLLPVRRPGWYSRSIIGHHDTEDQVLKIAVTGKGGTGKTTVAGILAHRFRDDGCRVLAVDADPDANLASAIGVSPERAAAIVPISEMHELIRERTGAEPGQFGQMFKINPRVSDIPDKYCVDAGGIKLVVMGAVKKGGGGCACPEGVLLQSLLIEIMLNRDDVVVVDMEAGIEHLGRATCKAVDTMVVVVEPGARSVGTAKKIMDLASEIGVESFTVVGNKIRGRSQEEWIAGEFPSIPIAGMIPYSEAMAEADMRGISPVEVIDRELEAEFEKVYKALRSAEDTEER